VTLLFDIPLACLNDPPTWVSSAKALFCALRPNFFLSIRERPDFFFFARSHFESPCSETPLFFYFKVAWICEKRVPPVISPSSFPKP